MATVFNASRLDLLIKMLDEAVKADGDSTCCSNVKRVLEQLCTGEEDFLDPHYLEPVEGGYARRLVHMDPSGAYTVLAMVWGKGQGAPLHDHAGHWCCECVYRGRIKVVQFSLESPPDAEVLQFKPQFVSYAGVGEAGALIPPFEYHSIENPDGTPAVTLHVYSGELTWCHTFVPVEGGFKRVRKELTYTSLA
jgi:predicted metal-dependent enzyme (double-stranded beta helix superfamily)